MLLLAAGGGGSPRIAGPNEGLSRNQADGLTGKAQRSDCEKFAEGGVLRRVREVARLLDYVGHERHRHSLIVLKLRETALNSGGSLHGLHQRQKCARQEYRDGNRDHELDQAEAVMRECSRPGIWTAVGHVIHGCTYSV